MPTINRVGCSYLIFYLQTRLTVGHGVHLRASTRCAPRLCPAMTHADISHPLRSCSMSRHSPYVSGLSNVHLRACSQCPLAIPSTRGSLLRAKSDTGTVPCHLLNSLLWSCPLCGHKQVPEEDALCAASKDASLVVRASISLFILPLQP